LILEILLVDNEYAEIKPVSSLVERMGHTLRMAENGEEAMAMIADFPPQLILSDWEMPVMDGIAFCKAFRKLKLKDYVYFIMMSGRRTSRKDMHDALDSGVDDFLSKANLAEDLPYRLAVAERILGFRNQFIRMAEMIPICSSCKKVRQEAANWTKLESYLEQSLRLPVSHGLCPDCFAKSYKGAGSR
jgi:CheY-like chemotaxis protein